MYITHLLFITSLKIFVEKACGSAVAPSKLLVTRIGPCYGINLPISVSEMAITRKQSYFTVSGQLNVTAEVANGWSIKGTMQKCHDIRNLDTCDHYRSLTVVKSGCEGDNESDQRQQKKFLQYVTPRMECPLQAGVYQISNYPFLTEVGDLTAGESKISTSVFGYTYRLDGFDEDYQKIMCVDAFLKHIYVRKHNWIGNQTVRPVKLPANNQTANDVVVKKHNDNDDAEDDDDEGQNDDSEIKTAGKHVNNEANDDNQEYSDTNDVKKEDDDGNEDDNVKDTEHDDDEGDNNEAAKDAQNDYEEEDVKTDDSKDEAKNFQNEDDKERVKPEGNDDVKNDEANDNQNKGDVNADDSEDAKNNEDKDKQNDDDAGDIKNNKNEDVTPSDAEDVKNVDGDANDAETEAPNTQSDDENDEENEE